MATLPRPAALVFFRDVTTLPTLLAILGGQTASMAPLLPRVVAGLRGQVSAIDTIIASTTDDGVAAELAREAKATTLSHIDVLDQVATSAS